VPRVAQRVVEARRERAAELLREHRYLGVADVARHLGVSENTARRDLAALAESAKATRTIGGAVAAFDRRFASFAERAGREADRKRAIARAAASLVEPGKTVFLDAGTTLAAVADAIAEARPAGLGVVTHSLAVAERLGAAGVSVRVLGGTLLPRQAVLLDERTLREAGRLKLDLALLGAEAFDASGAGVARGVGRHRALDHGRVGRVDAAGQPAARAGSGAPARRAHGVRTPMPRTTTHVAVDLGAESGRVMLGRVSPDAIAIEEVHRWPSRRARVLGGERWDVLFMWQEIVAGLKLAAAQADEIASVSVDTWGVDYVYVPTMPPPFMYRDTRTAAAYGKLTDDDRGAIFAATGVQFMPINTLYQLMSDDASAAAGSDGLLLIADFFHYLLTGERTQERSLASTTQLYDPNARGWSDDLVARFGLDGSKLPPLIDAGATVATITAEVAEMTGLPAGTRVVATCSHDTGNAVAATPLTGGAAYLSSGTWSLLGVEAPEPVINDATLRHNFTNEVGFGHSIRLLKNLSGLFLVQESRREFEGQPSYAELADAAEASEPARSLIRPDAPQFATPGDMPAKIADFCRETGQPTPETPGQIVRCCYESLALLYAETLDALAEITGHRPTSLNVVGGGSNATLLNQLAADACGVPVEAGPAEATALGNVGIQGIAAGTIGGLDDLRRLVRTSFNTTSSRPSGDLAAQADRFRQLPR